MSNPPKPNNLKLRRIPKKSPKIKKKLNSELVSGINECL